MLDYRYYLEQYRYVNCDNYYIESLNPRNRICYIFCSSNGIYTKIDETNYKKYIDNDYYEWKNISKNRAIRKKAGLFIFIRDVFQKSYVNGINSTINNINKLIEFLKEKTKGYDIILVGNSGGGYLSILLGSQLDNVKRVYSFGGLFSLYTWTGSNNNVVFANTYKEQIGDKEKEKWFSLYNMIDDYPVPLLHFYGAKHEGDLEQVRSISNKNLKNVFLFKMDSTVHSGHLPGYNYPKLLSASNKHFKKIQNLSKKALISSSYFSIKNIGLFKYLFYKVRSIFKRIIRK